MSPHHFWTSKDQCFHKHSCYFNKMWEHMQFHGFCDHCKKHYFHQSKMRRKNDMKNIIIRPTFVAKYFHKWKGHYTPYKYTTPKFQKNVVMFN
jgi:hypothetical protein